MRIATLSKGSKVTISPCLVLTVQAAKALGINDYWCGRTSQHTPSSLQEYYDADEATPPPPDGGGLHLVRTLSVKYRNSGEHERPGPHPAGHKVPTGDLNDEQKQARVMKSTPRGIYEQFRRGLLEYHSEVNTAQNYG